LHEYAGKSPTDLISELRRVLSALDESQKTSDDDTLQKIVAFCASLSDELSLRAQAIADGRKPNDPYRR
jgi:hypothetical protein